MIVLHAVRLSFFWGGEGGGEGGGGWPPGWVGRNRKFRKRAKWRTLAL